MNRLFPLAGMPADRRLRFYVSFAAAVMLVSASVYFVLSWRWPLVGDASLIHYLCFLMDHGMAPYRDLGDMNMPGSFLVEWSIMHTLGEGALAWRMYDFLLMLVAAGAMASITRASGWFAGIFSATLFVLVHGRDGMAQGGQRDLAMAVALLAGTAMLFQALRAGSTWRAGGFGLLAGIAVTIKPTAALFAVGLLMMAVYTLRRRGQPVAGTVWAAVGGLLVAPMVAGVFLWREGAAGAFFHGLRTVVPYYASLGHQRIGYLLTHSVSPLMPLIAIWLVLMVLVRPRLGWERAALLTGAGLGLISYVVQWRGYPYYRYPMLAFLLPLIAIDLTDVVRADAVRVRSSKVAGWLALAGIAVGALVIAPMSARLIAEYDWQRIDFITSLEGNLKRAGGAALSGHVQCIDSISGCGTTLYRMRLVQATGVFSDFLLFGPGDVPVVQETRDGFTREVVAHPPTVMVVSSYLHIGGPDGYAKLERWPWLRDYLATRYCMTVEWSPGRPQRWWSRAELPNGYRVYALRGSAQAERCVAK